MSDMNDKDREKYNTLIHNTKWVEMISKLKKLNTKEYDNKIFTIIYRKDTQKKIRSENFEVVQYVEDTSSFIFDDGALVLKITDVIDFKIEDMIDPLDYTMVF